MNLVITQYDPITGKLDAVISADPPIMEPVKVSNPYWIEGKWDDETHYVVDGEAVQRPENPTTLNDLTLENVPVPALVTINGTPYETDSDTIELEFDQVGAYKITIDSFPYLPKEFEIEITTL